jgi:hypothetical protein
MDAGINNFIYMELHSGPKMVNGTCCGNDRSRFHCNPGWLEIKSDTSASVLTTINKSKFFSGRN